MRERGVEVEAAVVHIHLEIPAWNNVISIINSCTNLNSERAIKSYSPTISMKMAKSRRGLALKLKRIIDLQIPAESTRLVIKT